MPLTNIETTIILDLYDHDATPSTIKAIQLDSNTRYVAAVIRDKGETYDIGASAGVTLTVIRPDRTGVQITGSPRAQSEFTPGGEEVVTYGAYAELSQTALAVKGTLKAQFMFTSGEQVLRSEIFAINCGEALDASTSEWADEYQGWNLDEFAAIVNGVENMTVTSQTLPQGASATVTKTEDAEGVINLDFGLPLASGEVQVVNVSGANPAITAEYNKRYVCGEVSTLTITPATQGCTDVLFTSGTTPTVLSLPNTVKMPSWFTVEANKTYEISILDGIYGAVMAWT